MNDLISPIRTTNVKPMETNHKPVKAVAGDYRFKGVHILRIAPRKFQVQTNRTADGWNTYKSFTTLRAACDYISTLNY